VRSLLGSEGVDVDVTVIDNGQQHGPALETCLPDATRVVRTSGNTGYTGGANAALRDWTERHPDAGVAVVGSHDLHVEQRTLATLVDVAQEHPRAGIVAPILTSPNPAAGGTWTGTRSFQVALREGENGVIARDWTSGTCLLLRAACVAEVGEFDERLGSYMEDVDYGLRVRRHGWSVLVATTARAHGVGSTSGDSVAAIARNTVLVAAKHGGRRGALRAFSLLSFWAGRGLVTSVLPVRDRARRARSWHYARQRFAGLARVVADGTLREILREPSGGKVRS
jgi:GT2 family glycosyltransferase